ncbi:hypothetical protein PS659_03335 [Pseudomonas fluorescens]|uniref:Uncharacterized protein n=1 Tax=Pseudomonas fluorescens TaxID=294 RepID=A0A5E6U4N2_PSEFL|nr:hypothetical protein PS659_03335 [Pseudomonas fluorescens]
MNQFLTNTGKRFDLPDSNAKTSLDAQETKSLCCKAAGIIAPLGATAEALIPHEKLRGAATPDATLIAQNCPHAQPAVGYTAFELVSNLGHLEESNRPLPTELTHLLTSLGFNALQDGEADRKSTRHLIGRRILVPSKTIHPCMKLKPKAESYIQSLSIDFAPLNIGQPRQEIGVNPLAILLSVKGIINRSSLRALKLNDFTNLSAQAKKLFRLCNFECAPFISPDSHFMAFLVPWDRNSNRNTQNRTNCLHPSGSVRRQHSIFNPIRHRPHQQPQSSAADQKPPDSPESTNDHLFRNFQFHYFSRLRVFFSCSDLFKLVKAPQGGAS